MMQERGGAAAGVGFLPQRRRRRPGGVPVGRRRRAGRQGTPATP